jgi:hypothetical protein
MIDEDKISGYTNICTYGTKLRDAGYDLLTMATQESDIMGSDAV